MNVKEIRLYEVLKDDLERLTSKLRISLAYALHAPPLRPILRIDKISLRGEIVSDSFFHKLMAYDGNFIHVCALDSSLKLLMDFGSLKAYLIKTAMEVFVGKRRIELKESFKLITAISRREALKRMAQMEYSIAEEVIEKHEPDLLLLDRGLINLAYKGRKSLFKKAVAKQCSVVGICKSSTLTLEDGTPLLSYLALRGALLGYDTWYYHPLFPHGLYARMMGEVTVVKLSPESPYVFRVDVYAPQEDLVDVLGKVAALQDPALPGYPFPLIEAHRDSKIFKYELEIAREAVEERLRGLAEPLDLCCFRRRDLEGRSYRMG